MYFSEAELRDSISEKNYEIIEDDGERVDILELKPKYQDLEEWEAAKRRFFREHKTYGGKPFFEELVEQGPSAHGKVTDPYIFEGFRIHFYDTRATEAALMDDLDKLYPVLCLAHELGRRRGDLGEVDSPRSLLQGWMELPTGWRLVYTDFGSIDIYWTTCYLTSRDPRYAAYR